MTINMIVAMDENGLIGDRDKLPWKIPEDLKYFKEKTMNHTVVMGRKTYYSIGKPLRGRENIVITRKDFGMGMIGDTHVYLCNLEQALEIIDYKAKDNEEVFIIGGSEIYKQFYHYCDKLYVTWVDGEYEGNTYFPYPIKRINRDFEIESTKIFDKGSFNIMRRRS